MNVPDFILVLAARDDGFWELLATAVGNEHSVSKTVAGLKGSAFADGVGGLAGTPSLVQQRVDALAAYDPSLLVHLSEGWTKPSCLPGSMMDAESDLLIAAWLSATRFLVREQAVAPADLQTEVRGVREEARVHFGPPPVLPSTWDDLLRGFAENRLSYSDMRALDGVALSTGEINENKLHDLLSGGVPDGFMFERMRLFRKREGLLTSGAIRFLCEVVWSSATTSEDYLASPGFCVAAEFAVQVSAELRSKLMRRVADVLSQRGRPQDITQLSYLLLSTGWTMP